jgi:hypothetical protein
VGLHQSGTGTVDVVRVLENIQVKDLMKLLGCVKAPANVIAIEQRRVSTSTSNSTAVTTDRQLTADFGRLPEEEQKNPGFAGIPNTSDRF